MDYDKVVEYFAQKVDESRREEFREKASKIEDISEAEALGKEFGIEPSIEDRDILFKIAGEMELSDEMLSKAAGGEKAEGKIILEWGPDSYKTVL